MGGHPGGLPVVAGVACPFDMAHALASWSGADTLQLLGACEEQEEAELSIAWNSPIRVRLRYMRPQSACWPGPRKTRMPSPG